MQKPLKQGGQNQGQQQKQKQFNNGKQFPNKQQKYNAPSVPFNAFGTTRNFPSNTSKTQSRSGGPQSKFGTAANAIPLGGGG
jgi:hypothetical protein